MTKLLTPGRRLGTGRVCQLDDVVVSMSHFLKQISKYHSIHSKNVKNIARKYI